MEIPTEIEKLRTLTILFVHNIHEISRVKRDEF